MSIIRHFGNPKMAQCEPTCSPLLSVAISPTAAASSTSLSNRSLVGWREKAVKATSLYACTSARTKSANFENCVTKLISALLTAFLSAFNLRVSRSLKSTATALTYSSIYSDFNSSLNYWNKNFKWEKESNANEMGITLPHWTMFRRGWKCGMKWWVCCHAPTW